MNNNEEDYGYFIDIDFDIESNVDHDKFSKNKNNLIQSNNIQTNKKTDNIIKNPIENTYIIFFANVFCFFIFFITYIYVSPPFK